MEAAQIGLTWSAVSVAGLALYKVLRPMVPAKVNCWFCNDNFNVNFNERNSWTCPGCCQYNGFASDGDYNRDIPDQTRESNDIHFAVQSPESEKKEGNGLCQTCNLNQELKVHQLRKFVPSHPDRFDDEVLEYQQHLDRTYRLCRYCEATLHQKLGEQDSWLKPKLLAAKLELSRRSPIQLGRSFRNDDVTQRRATFILSLALFVATLCCDFIESLATFHHFSSTLGFAEIVTSLLLTILTVYGLRPWSLINHGCHKVSVLAWILLFVYAANESVISTNLPDFESNKSSIRSVAAFFVFAMAFHACKTRARQDKAAERAKKMKKTYPKVTFSHTTMQPIEESDETLTQDLLSTTSTTISSTATLKTAKSLHSPTRPPIRAPQFGPLLSNHEFHQSEEKELSALSFCSEGDADQPVNPIVKTALQVSELHIDQAGSIASTGRSPPFEVRRYDAADNSGIFSSFGGSGRPVLKPPRFVYEQPRRVAQSSWVAGGYWHQSRHQTSPQNLTAASENLSRSSSQTSGFFSASGMIRSQDFASLPNSRVNSVCGDRHSVLSEPVYNFGKTDFSLNSLGNQLAFYDTSRTDTKLRHLDDDDSDLSVGRHSQEAFSTFKPRAESSPLIEKRENWIKSEVARKESILEKKIEISFSLSSLLLAASLTLNFGVIWYLVLM